jgi:hypothetical protein
MTAKEHLSPQFGYRTEHTKWWDVEKHAEHETQELGNTFPDVSHLKGYEGIWVTHHEKDARKYGEDIREVNLSGATKIHDDEDGGYFYARPKTKP